MREFSEGKLSNQFLFVAYKVSNQDWFQINSENSSSFGGI